MPKVVFIGGGSSKFIYDVTRDMFTFPGLRNVEISLMDINRERLERTDALIRKMIGDLGINARVESTTDRRRALAGADYVIVTIMVGRFEAYALDMDIPASYGVYQCIGDTIGPGGVFRYLRTIPVLQGLVDDVNDFANPGAWIINYSNPMAMNVWGVVRHGFDRIVGLCHSIQLVAQCIAEWVGVPKDEIVYSAGGINHVDFYLKLEHNGEDLYPRLLEAEEDVLASGPNRPSLKSSFELLRYFGYWPAETGFHQTEYYPYFRKTREMGDEYNAPFRDGLKGNKADSDRKETLIPQMTAGEVPIDYDRGLEYAANIINAMETGEPFLFYGNVENRGLIENLPFDAAVEVPCTAEASGIVPGRVGRIPPQLAGLMMPHIHVHELAVEAAVRHDGTLVEQAIMLDPLTSTVLRLPDIHDMVGEMFEANRSWLEEWF